MAIGVTRVSGDTQLVNNVGDGYTKNANAQIAIITTANAIRK